MAKIPITEIRDQSVKPLSNPVTLYFCFCGSFWPTASVLISVRAIVCVAWPIVSFSSHRPCLEKHRVSHSFWVARQFAKNKMKLTIKGKHNAFAPHGTASFSFSHFAVVSVMVTWSYVWNISYIELRVWNQVSYDLCNRPFYSCALSCLACEWKWGWRWPCFDRNITAFLK